jgi:hypothetical protein
MRDTTTHDGAPSSRDTSTSSHTAHGRGMIDSQGGTNATHAIVAQVRPRRVVMLVMLPLTMTTRGYAICAVGLDELSDPLDRKKVCFVRMSSAAPAPASTHASRRGGGGGGLAMC